MVEEEEDDEDEEDNDDEVEDGEDGEDWIATLEERNTASASER